MEIGNKIMSLRKKAGLSQEELAEKVGVSRQTISKWELSETNPDIKQAKKLSKIFNVSLDELVDNDIKDVLVEKVTNTEKTTKKSFTVLKIVATFIIGFILLFILLVIIHIVKKNSIERGREIEESIHCELYGEEHSFTISYYELTGVPFALGGDPYFTDILDLGKYEDAHQIFNIINDYVKKNNGTCYMSEDKNLDDIVDMTIKEGSLSKTGLTVLISEKVDYDISYGETFWLEKYSEKSHDFEVMTPNDNNCAFNLPAYIVTPDKPLELKQDWSCFYGELDKGLYRLVKDVYFESDRPIDENDKYYISVEFDIE